MVIVPKWNILQKINLAIANSKIEEEEIDYILLDKEESAEFCCFLEQSHYVEPIGVIYKGFPRNKDGGLFRGIQIKFTWE